MRWHKSYFVFLCAFFVTVVHHPCCFMLLFITWPFSQLPAAIESEKEGATKAKRVAFQVDRAIMKLIREDTVNKKLWDQALATVSEGKQVWLSLQYCFHVLSFMQGSVFMRLPVANISYWQFFWIDYVILYKLLKIMIITELYTSMPTSVTLR